MPHNMNPDKRYRYYGGEGKHMCGCGKILEHRTKREAKLNFRLDLKFCSQATFIEPPRIFVNRNFSTKEHLKLQSQKAKEFYKD